MPRYKISNRITKEASEVEAPFAQDACEILGWMIGNCHVELLREGPYTYSAAPKSNTPMITRNELLAMPEADAVAALADEANWPADITGAVRAEWHKMTAQERLVWIHNTEEIRRTMDVDVFRQWQGCGPTKPKHDSIPRWYKQCWEMNSRRLRND